MKSNNFWKHSSYNFVNFPDENQNISLEFWFSGEFLAPSSIGYAKESFDRYYEK